ncbi:discoidin domain-containing protein [Myxococcus sp. CA051A]|uniref:PKD domain-containing protein n=1 Tax=Myxococcus sp. CA051A TaxID=2741739 RepID=UPI00157A96B1|nr:discoidin domain-containing protein [Myxococcus sp. CA051A]NTX60549.1 discoidin domain-containing protein [Myxococcus sp. CA051A]
MNKKFIMWGSCIGALVLSACGEAPGAAEVSSRASALDDGLVNVTLNKPTTASHTQLDPQHFLPQYAVDGNITSDDSRWCTGEYIYAPRYLDIDLQGTFDLHRAEVYTGYQSTKPIANFDLLYHDGTSWQPIPGAARTGNTSVAVSTTFTQVVRGQKVRFLCNEPGTSNCRVKEVWVFGAPATPGANQAPVANAGADRSLVLPTSSLTLTGTGTDADGTIASYAWTQVSGTTATLSGASTATLAVSGLSAGTFVFRLTVTDDDGATHSDDVTVTVTNAPPNQAPVANAGADRTVVLPNAGITLTGSGTDSDGNIASYSWTQVSGPTASLSGANTPSLSVSGLAVGTLVFRLTVTDDDGATHADTATVTVTNASTLTNVARLKPAVAMHTSGSNVAARATDDNLSTRWESVYANKPGTYLDVDLQGAYEIHSAEVHLSFSTDSSAAMTNFDLQAWDGGCWKTIPGSSVRNNPGATTLKNVTFTAPVIASKVRLLCLDSDGDENEPCLVRELKVMGKPATTSTGPLSCTAGEQIAVRDSRYSYALFLPAGYNADRNARWPLIISLPGTGGVMLANDHLSVSSNAEGLAWSLNSSTYRAGFGAIAASLHYWKEGPIGNEKAYFTVSTLMAILEDLKRDYLVDTDRVYFTGFSGGANVLYDSAGLPVYMSKVAAFVPIAVTSTPTNVANICNLRTLPTWPFHGGSDSQGGADKSTGLKTMLETQCGGTTSAMLSPTVYPGVGHSNTLWQNAYATPALWTWLFQQRISNRQ